MASEGRSSADLRQRAAISTASKKDGTPPKADVIREALEAKKELIASNIMASAASGSEADALESDNKRAEAELKRGELEMAKKEQAERLKGGGGAL